jgi:hypothetical protein
MRGMADLALGGIELALSARPRGGHCLHETTLSVAAAGVERSICESCGHISVVFLTELSGPVYRKRFARPADEAADSPLYNPFAEEERLGVRRREHAAPGSLLLTA